MCEVDSYLSVDAVGAMDSEMTYREFDLTLTDRDLEDFLAVMEQQNAGDLTGGSPRGMSNADVYMQAGLQVQPHSNSSSSPTESADTGSMVAVEQRHDVGAAGPFDSSRCGLGPSMAGGGIHTTYTPVSPGSLPPYSVAVPTGHLDRRAPLQLPTEQHSLAPLGCTSSAPPRLPIATHPLAVTTVGPVPLQSAASLPLPLHSAASLPLQSAASLPLQAAASLPLGPLAPPPALTMPPVTSFVMGSTAPPPPSLMPLPHAGWPPHVVPPAVRGHWPPHPRSHVQQMPMPQPLLGPPPPPGLMPPGMAGLSRPQPTPGLLLQSQPPPLARYNSGPLPTSSGPGAGAGSPGSVADDKLGMGSTHSTVEKQRRDRLNSLIEELSEMVPPSDAKYAAEGCTTRRPKHVVLADTIVLLHHLQDRVRMEEAQISQLRAQAAQANAAAAAAEAAAAHRHAALGMIRCSPDGTPELPLAPHPGLTATGVVVEQGPNCLYVKVNCRDRKGLLSDLIGALKSFPVVISRAAITTTREGKVYDVFEVRPEGNALVVAEDVQCAVHMALYASDRIKGKRQRVEGSV